MSGYGFLFNGSIEKLKGDKTYRNADEYGGYQLDSL
jgi:hypothetical protein